MRRARFSDTVESHEAATRASMAQAIRFDVTRPESASDDTLAEHRVGQLQIVQLLLFVVHSLCAVAVFVFAFVVRDAALALAVAEPLGLSLTLDCAAAATIHYRKRIGFMPRAVTHVMCGYGVLVSGLWVLFDKAAASSPALASSSLLPFIVGAGVMATATLAIESPPIAILCGLAGAITAFHYNGGLSLVLGIVVLSLVAVAYSAIGARNNDFQCQT